MWDRDSLESVPRSYWPHVRCEYDGRQYRGRIVPEGNNPWVVVEVARGKVLEQRVSWGLVLSVINDGTAAPIHFGA